MIVHSKVTELNDVVFPEFDGNKAYMVPFLKKDGLPNNLTKWQGIVDSMLAKVDTTSPVYFMLDQKEVKAGTIQRRPGVHIDGFWDASAKGHGHSIRYVNEKDQEAVILATNEAGVMGYEGEWDFSPALGGDCSHISLKNMASRFLEAGKAYLGDTMYFLHESLPILRDCFRIVVRLNVPGYRLV